MTLKIINESESPLLNRKELEIEATFNKATNTNADVLKEISSLTKTKEDLIKIKKIHQLFGVQKARIKAYIYKSQEDLKKIEEKKKKVKKKESKPEEKKE